MARRSEFDVTIGERVAALRAKRGLSMKELADRAGYGSPETVSKIEANAGFRRGKREGVPTNARAVTVRDLLALAHALNVNPLDLLLPLDDAALVEIPTRPIHHVPSWLVRSWIGGNGPLDDQDDDEYFDAAPPSVQRRHATWRHPAVSRLNHLRTFAETAVVEDFSRVAPAVLADALRTDLELVTQYVQLLATETEMKETGDGQG